MTEAKPTAEIACSSVRRSLWDFSAGTLDPDSTRMVEAHLEECRECGLHRAEVRSLSTGLKHLPKMTPAPLLHTRLSVIASRERSRMMLRRTLALRFAELRSRFKLMFDNVLRPIAIPAMGGMVASFLCFGVIVDTLQFHPEWVGDDIPVGYHWAVAMDDVTPFSDCDGKDVLVQLTIDSAGNVIGFEVPGGNATPAELKEIGNLVLYSSFSPAMAFGEHVTGKIFVQIQHLKVRG